MKKSLFIIGALFTAINSIAQVPSIDAGPDQEVCPPECVTVTAVYEGGGGNTSDYETSVIDYAPDPYAGTLVDLWDDDITPALPIGFEFCFYGNTYTEFYICSNGWVGFQDGPTTFTSSTIPSTDPDVPKNCIMGPWYDIDPGFGGEVRYQLLGTAPVRRMVVSYVNVPHFLCDDQIETYQVIFYETSNDIENHIEQKAACLGWDDGFAVQGLHNIDGTEAVPFPGRNNTVWEVTNDAVRFSPLGEPEVLWFDEAGTMIGEGPEIELCPEEPTTYTVQLLSCGVVIAEDDVFVDVVCCEPPVMTKTDVTCFGACDGTGTADPSGVPPFTYLWDDPAAQTTATAIGLCPGTYTVTVQDAEDCIEEGTITIEEPEELTMTLDITHVSCEGADDGAIIVTAAGGTAPITIEMDGAPSVSGSFTGLSTGTYTILVTDANGCQRSQDVEITDSPLPVVSFEGDVLSGCEPLEVVFTNTGETGASCLWDFGDGSSSSSCETVTHVYSDGLYDVSLTVTNAGGCSTTVTLYDYVNAHSLPNANYIFSPNNVTTLDTEVNFTDLSSGATGWSWEIADLSNSNDQNPTYEFPATEGDYPVELLVVNEFGCEDSITKIVRVNQKQLIFAPNIFTPDGDDFNEVFLPYFTGIDIYDYHLIIYNRWGEILFESYNPAVGWDGTYGGEIVQDGTYIWQILTADIVSDAKLEFYGHVTVVK